MPSKLQIIYRAYNMNADMNDAFRLNSKSHTWHLVERKIYILFSYRKNLSMHRTHDKLMEFKKKIFQMVKRYQFTIMFF